MAVESTREYMPYPLSCQAREVVVSWGVARSVTCQKPSERRSLNPTLQPPPTQSASPFSVCDASLDCVWDYVFSIESMCALLYETDGQNSSTRTSRNARKDIAKTDINEDRQPFDASSKKALNRSVQGGPLAYNHATYIERRTHSVV